MNIILNNKIEQKVNEYKERTGATKTWIAKQMDMSPARLYQIMKSDDLMVSVVAKFAIALNCKIEDLIEYYNAPDDIL